MIRALSILILTCCYAFSGGCRSERTAKPLGDNLAHPVAVVSDPTGSYFYLLNSNASNQFAGGSLSVIATTGERVKTVATPRLGRSLAAEGDFLLATFSTANSDVPKETHPAKALLFDISTPEAPALVKTWELKDCSPINGILRAPYMAVSCRSGQLYAGRVDGSPTLKHLRSYPNYARRAIHIDSDRGLLLAFVTDYGKPNLGGRVWSDKYHWKDDERLTGSDERPDELYRSPGMRRHIEAEGSAHQFAVLDLTAAEASGWKHRPFSEVREELRWLYFDLTNFDGTPDVPLREGERYYRTNFWEAKPDAEDRSQFYLSHRGRNERGFSEQANNIIRVTITGDLRDPALKTSEVLTFKRVFGFRGDQSQGLNYFGDFALTRSGGQPVILVNSFRDPVYFSKPRYALMAAPMEGYHWFTQKRAETKADSYFQLAVGKEEADGSRVVASCSYYGNSAIMHTLRPGGELEFLRRVP